MRLIKWVSVTTALWLAMEVVSKDCTEEQVRKAKQMAADKKGLDGTQKFLTGTTVALGLIGAVATIATAGAAAPVFAPMVAGMAAGSGLLSGFLSIFSPSSTSECTLPDPKIQEIKDLVEKIMPAIKELTNIVITKFDDLQKHIDQAVQELKEAIDQTQATVFQNNWQTNVLTPMEQLRLYAVPILSGNLTNVHGDVVLMSAVCKSDHANPLVIATHIWGIYGDGCKKTGPKTRKVEGPFCDINSPHYRGPCPEIERLCYSELFIRSTGHNHSAASQVFQMVAGTLLELTTYHTMCVNFTYVDPEVITSVNNAFINETDKILTQLQKIIIAETERYWPHAAEEVMKNVVSKESDLEKAGKLARKELDQKFFWFHHQTLAFRNPQGIGGVVGGTQPVQVSTKEAESDAVVYAYHYRYASPEDKTKMEKKGEEHKKWMASSMTGNYSAYTVGKFISKITNEESENWSWTFTQVLNQQANGETQPERMSACVNIWTGGTSAYHQQHVDGNFDDCGPSWCFMSWQPDFGNPNSVFLIMAD